MIGISSQNDTLNLKKDLIILIKVTIYPEKPMLFT